MTVQNRSSHEEVQNVIYRGCARLMKAMQVKRIAPSSAQRWEDEALREAREVLSAVLKCRLKSGLVIPPLPIALLEVHHCSHQISSRPLRPSDIYSPLKQASTSWWTHFIASEDYPRIPSDVNLGDPSTFWWEEVEERDTIRKVVGKNDRDERASILPTKNVASGPDIFRRFPTPYPTNAKRSLRDEDEFGYSSADGDSKSQVLKRRRTIAATESEESDEDVGGFFYVPKRKNCRERVVPCHVMQRGEPCVWCRSKRRRCTAYRGSNQVVKRSTASGHGENKSIKDRIKLDDQPRPRALEPRHPPSQFGNAVQTKIDPPASKSVGQNQERRPAVACYNDGDMPTKLRKIVLVRPTRDTTKTACIGNPLNKEQAERPIATQRDLANTDQTERTPTAQRDIEKMGAQLRTTAVQPLVHHGSSDMTGVSIGTVAPAPKQVPSDKSVGTGSRPGRQSDDSEVDFKKILASVILETIELQQRRTARATLCTDGSQSAGAGTEGSTTGERVDDHVEFTKELMSLMLEVVQLRSQRSK